MCRTVSFAFVAAALTACAAEPNPSTMADASGVAVPGFESPAAGESTEIPADEPRHTRPKEDQPGQYGVCEADFERDLAACPDRPDPRIQAVDPMPRHMVRELHALVDACELWVDRSPPGYVIAERRTYSDPELDSWSIGEVCGDEVIPVACVAGGPCPEGDLITVLDLFHELAVEIRGDREAISIQYDHQLGHPVEAFVLYDGRFQDWMYIDVSVPIPR
jgi:hypothetical protein